MQIFFDMIVRLLTLYFRAIHQIVVHPINTLLYVIGGVRKNALNYICIGLLLAVFLVASGMLATLMYAITYRIFIPTTYQSERIIFSPIMDGYEARIFHPHGKFPICSFNLTQAGFESKKTDYTSRICVNPTQLGESNFEFSPETYSIHLKLILPATPRNYEAKAFAVQTEFINKANYTMNTEAIGYCDDPVSKMWFPFRFPYRILRALSIVDPDIVANLEIMDKFDNSLFDINVINIRIPERRIIIKEGYLTLEAQLGGIRYMMVHWFWGTAATVISIWTIMNFIAICSVFYVYKKMRKIVKDVTQMEKKTD